MKPIARKLRRLAIVSMACMAVPAFAQDAMQGRDMAHMHHAATHSTQPAAANQSHAAKEKPAEGETSPLHAAHRVDTLSMPYTPLQPPPNLTGETKVLDIGAQIGVRPLMRGLNLQPMHMDMSGMHMQGGQVRPGARSADYSDGIDYGPMPGLDMMDDTALGMLLVDRLEYFNGRDAHGIALDAQAWYGTDANKLWLKAEGESAAGRLQDLRIEALFNHAVTTYWDAQVGIRQDVGTGPGRTWAALGVQGLAPYWFDVEATLYVGQAGRTALGFESEYELRLTQRLIVQPHVEANLYGRDDPQRGIGSGLSNAELGVRLRYAFTRKLAPYVGVEWTRTFGATADFARDGGGRTSDTRVVAGVRMWF